MYVTLYHGSCVLRLRVFKLFILIFYKRFIHDVITIFSIYHVVHGAYISLYTINKYAIAYICMSCLCFVLYDICK